MLDNARGKPFRCDQCDYTSNRSFDLRRHKQRHARARPAEGTVFKCSECAFITKWKRNMGRHMQKHRRNARPDDSTSMNEETIEEFIVEVIDATEADFEETAVETPDSTLSIVLPTDELKKRFKCDLCRYTSNRAFDLRRHEQTHYRLKVVDGIAYKCSECNFITKWKRNMRRHMRKHEEPADQEYVTQTEEPVTEEFMVEFLNDEILKSDADTDGAYNEQTDYSETQSSSQDFTPAEKYLVNGEKRYKCNQCQYESKRGFDLRRHAQVHTKRKPIQGIAYQCNDCLFITKWKRNMRRHMEKHKRSPVAAVEQCEDDEEECEEYVVELKSEMDSLVEKIQDDETEENPEVLPSYWIALPASET